MKNFHTKLPDLLGAGLQVLIYAGLPGGKQSAGCADGQLSTPSSPKSKDLKEELTKTARVLKRGDSSVETWTGLQVQGLSVPWHCAG